MINRGGFKIYSAEVENVISWMPGVEEVAVVGRPCPVLTERVHAFVKSSDAGVTAESVRAFCAEHLSDYKVPERIMISVQPLPRNPNGKILKEALRLMANAVEPIDE
jgi:O-succinylbenzoic acid--CoA ligase